MDDCSAGHIYQLAHSLSCVFSSTFGRDLHGVFQNILSVLVLELLPLLRDYVKEEPHCLSHTRFGLLLPSRLSDRGN